MHTQLSHGNGPFVFILHFKCKWQIIWTKTKKINQNPFTAKMRCMLIVSHSLSSFSSSSFSKQQHWLLWPSGVETSELNVSSIHVHAIPAGSILILLHHILRMTCMRPQETTSNTYISKPIDIWVQNIGQFLEVILHWCSLRKEKWIRIHKEMLIFKTTSDFL